MEQPLTNVHKADLPISFVCFSNWKQNELFADPDSDFDEKAVQKAKKNNYSSDTSSSDNEEIENPSESDEANGDNNEEPITFEIAFIYQNLSVHSSYKKIMLCFSVFANFIKNPRWPPVDQYGMWPLGVAGKGLTVNNIYCFML